MFSLKPSTTGLLLLLVLAVFSPGCQILHYTHLAKLPTASAEHPVVEIVCMWEPAEGTDSAGRPCRGFSGQVKFYALEESAPVRVDGKVRIYEYDDQGTAEEQQEPIHQFDFDSESFQSFLTETENGAAYQLFVPYTRPGSHQATCSLRVRLAPEEGSRVYSKMGTVVLPGTSIRLDDVPIGETKPESNRHPDSSSGQTVDAEMENSPESDVTTADSEQSAPVESSQADQRLLRSQLTEIADISASPDDESVAEAFPDSAESDTSPENDSTTSPTEWQPLATPEQSTETWEDSTPKPIWEPVQHPLLDE